MHALLGEVALHPGKSKLRLGVADAIATEYEVSLSISRLYGELPRRSWLKGWKSTSVPKRDLVGW